MSGSDGLARVTFLPGVMPPEPTASARSVNLPAHADEATSNTEGQLDKGGHGSDTAGADTVSAKLARRAENVSMHGLTRRGMSAGEIATLLRNRELDDSTIERELARLERAGLVDDTELAATLVRTLHERKGLGRTALSAELKRRKIDVAIANEALEAIDDEGELSRATELAIRRAPQLRNLDAVTASRRLTGFLLRKGYSGSIVRSAVDRALGSGASRRPGRLSSGGSDDGGSSGPSFA